MIVRYVVSGAGVLAVLLSSGCATRPAPVDRPASTLSGEVSYRAELPGGEGRHELAAGQSIASPPDPLPDNPLPAYPGALIDRELPPFEIGALVSIDTDGRVFALDVGDPQPPLLCADCPDAFRGSLRDALQQWRFQPLQIAGWIDGPDEDGDGEADSVLRGIVETRPYSLRLRFRFEVRDGQASVSAATIAPQ